MSAQARPTAGRWLHDYTKIGRIVAENGAELARCKKLATLTELQARGDLIAEAGTVLHETGRTPRQLVEERAEMLEALSRLVACHSTSNSPKVRESCWDQARAAIAKATGGAA